MKTLSVNNQESSKAALEVIEIIQPLLPRETPTKKMREVWRERFTQRGWISNYLIPGSKQSITLWRDEVGLCIQLGNVCRASTDLLKLETLHRLGRIREAILIVPSKLYAAFLGSNYASFTTASRDLSTFSAAVTVPITIIEYHPTDLQG